MHAPDRCVVVEPSGFVRLEQFDPPSVGVGADDARTYLFAQPPANASLMDLSYRVRHVLIVTRVRYYRPVV